MSGWTGDEPLRVDNWCIPTWLIVLMVAGLVVLAGMVAK